MLELPPGSRLFVSLIVFLDGLPATFSVRAQVGYLRWDLDGDYGNIGTKTQFSYKAF